MAGRHSTTRTVRCGQTTTRTSSASCVIERTPSPRSADIQSGFMRTIHLVPTAALVLVGLIGCRQATETRSSAPAAIPAQAPAGRSAAQSVPTAEAPSGNAFSGAIAETMDSGGYTYLRLRGGGKDDVGVAAPQFDAKVGDTITVSLDMAMENFQSKTL